MTELEFKKFFKIIKLLELVSNDQRFTFIYGYDDSEDTFTIDMSFIDGNFKMRDYTNMYGDNNESTIEFSEEKFNDLYSGIIDFLKKVNLIIQSTWIEEYLKTLK